LNVFQEYAAYYDLLYQDKDFSREADFVHCLIQREVPGALSLLDLGCGTGAHAAIFAELGYYVRGVDQSSKMLSQANRRWQALPPELRARLFFEQKDLRTLRLNKTFDAIVLLFHVISYQTSNADLQAAFATVAAHLNPNGIVLFDFWYGPAVLAHPPVLQMKTCENENCQISRTANPLMHPNDNVVDVHYEIVATDKTTSRRQGFTEIHRMRYLFKPELDLFLEKTGLVSNGFGEWFTGRVPGLDTWNVWLSATLSPQTELEGEKPRGRGAMLC
jgi:SAM-dependent methyltransferase